MFTPLNAKPIYLGRSLFHRGLKETTKNGIKSTFFILGWIAEKLPHLVREIHYRGHEVASHGYHHDLPDKLSAGNLKKDLTDSKKLLEDITGAEVVGYPTSINGIDELQEVFKGQNFPAAEKLPHQLVTFPIHPYVSQKDIKKVSDLISLVKNL